MNTAIVYVDGYNLYYGLLRDSPHKWLDLVKLFELILRAQAPEIDHVRVKYFTSPAIARYARHNERAVQSQARYHNALGHRYPDRFEIVLGRHHLTEGWLPQAHDKAPINHTLRHRVWQVEEKLTDVQLALHFYRDAARQTAKLQVVCSNDTDMAPAMHMVREDFPTQAMGLIAPLPEDASRVRVVAKSLSDLAHWTRRYIRTEELIAAQLPERVHTNKKHIDKPDYW